MANKVEKQKVDKDATINSKKETQSQHWINKPRARRRYKEEY